ncbi:MAG: hypothetical protein KIT81_16075 [Alphaproteobacteria bacterium]|nr:hypothetical protein [Alphaproteobacteria bacterium]
MEQTLGDFIRYLWITLAAVATCIALAAFLMALSAAAPGDRAQAIGGLLGGAIGAGGAAGAVILHFTYSRRREAERAARLHMQIFEEAIIVFGSILRASTYLDGLCEQMRKMPNALGLSLGVILPEAMRIERPIVYLTYANTLHVSEVEFEWWWGRSRLDDLYRLCDEFRQEVERVSPEFSMARGKQLEDLLSQLRRKLIPATHLMRNIAGHLVKPASQLHARMAEELNKYDSQFRWSFEPGDVHVTISFRVD